MRSRISRYVFPSLIVSAVLISLLGIKISEWGAIFLQPVYAKEDALSTQKPVFDEPYYQRSNEKFTIIWDQEKKINERFIKPDLVRKNYVPVVEQMLVFNTLSESEEVITFPDPNLENVIRLQLGKLTGNIYQSETQSIMRLNCYDKRISNLQGLQYLNNLTYLDLGRNQISDISILSGLTNLEIIFLEDNQITDINALSGLTNLTFLWLEENQISNISPLSGLAKLEDLDLWGNEITNISALANLTNLTSLWLGENQISDISPLNGLNNLEILDLKHNQIRDISALITNCQNRDIDHFDVNLQNNFLELSEGSQTWSDIQELIENGIMVAYEPQYTLPTVSTTDPTDNVTDVLVNKDITVTFSEDVQQGANYNNIKLEDANGNLIEVTKSISGNVLTINPMSDFAYGVNYEVYIPTKAVEDLNGNALADNYAFNFTTVASQPQDENNVVDIYDLAIVAQAYGTTNSESDINGDGVVDLYDLVILARNLSK